MNSTPSSSYPFERAWRWELLWILSLAAITTPVFWLTDFDITAANWFYHPEVVDQPWYEEDKPLWAFLYRASPLLAAAMAFSALLVMMLGSMTRRFRPYLRRAVFMLLLVLMGPGLVVNLIFKDNWERPRPRQVDVLGGQLPYLPPLKMGDFESPAKSFPAGHPSVSFALAAALWLLLRRRHLRWAIALAASATVLGALFGVGRMAAGGHFLSDVLWSAYFPWLVAMGLYYAVLRIPREEIHPPAVWQEAPPYPWRWASLYGVLFVAIAVAMAMATPHKLDWTYSLPSSEQVVIRAQAADIQITVLDDENSELSYRGKVRGFGLPNAQVGYSELRRNNVQEFTLTQDGLFTEIHALIKLRIPQEKVSRLIIDVPTGELSIACEKEPCALPEVETSRAPD